MKQKKKGFTLIELLAVIVILGIIALISVPVILNIIEESRLGAFKVSVQSVFKAYETYELKNEVENMEKVSIIDLPITHKENFISGKVYKEGNIVKVEDVSNGVYCVSGTLENLQVINGSCDILDTTPPEIHNVTSEVTTNSIKVYTTYKEEESFLSKHEYRIAKETENIEDATWISGEILTGNLSTKTFSGLTVNTSYKIQIRLTNTSLENNVSEIKEILVTTESIEKPVITLLTEKEYATSKELKIIYPEGTGLTYEYSTDGITWLSTKEKETTIKIEENGTIQARVYDGVNYVYTDNLIISGIDKTEPTISLTKEIVENKNVLIASIEPISTPSGYTYIWYKDGSIISGENSSSLTTTGSGIYQLKVTTGAGVERESNEITIESFTVNYDLTGGVGNIPTQTKIEDVNLTLTSVIPSREGYNFVGWRETEENVINYKSGDIYSENKDITLSAIWSYYGTSMQDHYENIYVRNLTDGKLYSVSKADLYDNYYAGNYDRPEGLNKIINTFTEASQLTPAPYATSNNYLSITNSGENTYELTRNASSNSWMELFIRAAGGTTNIEISDLKLNFEDGSSLTINEAVANSYIKPLVIITANSASSESHIWQNILDIKDGGSSGIADFPQVHVIFKTTEKAALKGYSFIASHGFSTVYDGTYLKEFDNIDLSIEP